MASQNKYQVKVGKKAKIAVEWNDNPINYSHEAKKNIISIMADRYGIPKESVKVSFNAVKLNELGEQINVSSEVINNIQDPKFQVKLFNDYIIENKIENIDFEQIKKIDSEINSKIDYDVYEKYRKSELEWIEWSNFLSYGPDNRFEYKDLKGLTLLSSLPENQGGKTSLAMDIPSFLFFGKTQKPYNLSECFNKFLDTPTFSVSGGIKIDGLDYVIERVVTRTRKRTGEWGDASQKVKYYQIVNGVKEDLPDESEKSNEQGEYSGKTNKIIKEAIGNEKDFGMIVMTTATDLFSLIEMGKTETGKLLSKWVGLAPLEEKDKLAKDKYKEVEKGLKSRAYDKTELNLEIENANNSVKTNDGNIKFSNEKITELIGLMNVEQQTKDTLLASKKQIDQNILKLDINTVNVKMSRIKEEGSNKRTELAGYKADFELVKDIIFDEIVYKGKINEDKEISIEINNIKHQITVLKTTNENLTKSEFCPTCKRKYDGLDNSGAIKENEKKITDLTASGVTTNEKLNLNKLEILKLEEDKKLHDKKLKLEGLIEIIPVQIQNLLGQYKENEQKIKEFNDNKDAITKNNEIDISLTNINAKINSFSVERDIKLREIENYKRNNIESDKKIKTNEILIKEIDEEVILIRNWKAYLEMVGKNGVSKMILKKTLPIINSEVSRLLEDVCDFDVEVALTDKNEVVFNIIKDDVTSSLGGASGFEKTVSALALRCVLGNISTMPRPNFLILDEVLGGVAKVNYDNIRELYRKIEKDYQFILHVTHLNDIKDWHENTILVSKELNISSVSQITNTNH